MSNPSNYYNKKIQVVEKELKAIENKLNIYATIRLIIVALVLLFMYLSFKKDSINLMGLSFLCGLIIFVVVAFIHNGTINKKNKKLLQLEYYDCGIKRLNNKWKEFSDVGEEYKELNHNFTSDLDIFGLGSLFQWCNVTRTKFGRNALANMMKLKTLPTKSEIEKKQCAIRELASKRDFCESIYVNGFKIKKKKGDIEEVLTWFKQKEKVDITIKYVPYLFIAITSILLFLCIIGRIPLSVFILDLVINYLIIKLLTRRLSDVTTMFIKNKINLIQYADILNIIQDEEFESESLREIQNNFKYDNVNCKTEMNKLKNIISWLGDSSSNAYYIIINVFFMADMFILHNLEKWKKENGQRIEKWLLNMGEIESLCSLSNLAFENEIWTYPEISADKLVKAEGISHPLLGDRGKGNDFNFNRDEKVALITGSNMSGKSTFLRTIGFNFILAYLGLPVKASYLKCGIYNIYTCMRTQDNLEESISSFYAEILRIKLVIEASKSGERVFFLLDEIFKGTNSKDRHHGAKILIEQLVNENAIGMVSTHDLELCDLEKEKKWLVNYNFREYYEDDKIKFDYMLRRGKSETQNAKHLMRLAGIEFEN